MWLYRMHFAGDREFITCDPWGYQDAANVERELPYLESLLSFLELDISALTPVITEICENWDRFFATGDREFSTKAMQLLGQLTAQHVYFHLPYLRWFERTAREQLKPEMADELRRNRRRHLWNVFWILTGWAGTHGRICVRTISSTSRRTRTCFVSRPSR